MGAAPSGACFNVRVRYTRVKQGNPMTKEAETTSEEVTEPVTPTETGGSESETEQTEQDTQPAESVEQTEETFTKAQVEAMFDKRSARIKKQLQREWEAKQPPPKVSEPEKGVPKLEDFETTEEWLDARTDWKYDQKVKAEAQKAEAQQQEKENARLRAKYDSQQAKMSDKYDDYDDLMDNMKDYDIPPYISTAVMESDIGGELSYFLGKNPDELEKILGLSPLAAVKALGRIELKLESAPKPKDIPKAPAPFKGVKGDSKPSSMEISPKDDFETFVAKRNYQLGRE